MSRPTSGPQLRGLCLCLCLCMHLCLLALLPSCERGPRTGPSPTAATALADGGQPHPDLASAPATWSQASPDVLIYSAALAMAEGDRASAHTVVELALKKLGAQLSVQPAMGLLDPLAANQIEQMAEPVARDISASGSHLAVGHGRLLSAVELSGAYRTLRLAEHPRAIRDVVLSANGHRVATLDEAHTVRMFALPTGSLVAEYPLHIAARDFSCSPSCISFSPDSRWLLLADCGAAAQAGEKSCALSRLRVIETAGGALRSTLQEETELLSYTSRSDGNLAVLRGGEPPRFFDLATALPWPGPALDDFRDAAHRGCLALTRDPGRRSWAVSPERRILATLETSGTLCLWDLAEHGLKQAMNLRALGDRLRLHSLLAEGAGILIAQESRTLLLISGTSGARRGTLPAGLTTFPLDDGGALLFPRTAAGRGPQLAHRIELMSGEPRISTYPLPITGALQLELGNVSGDGRYLFAVQHAAQHATAQLIELARPPHTLPLPAPLSPGCCTQADFLDLNRRLVYADPTGTLRVHSIPDGAVLHATPMLQSVTSLHYRSLDELQIDLGDGRSARLWMAAGRLSFSGRDTAPAAVNPESSPALDALRREAAARHLPGGSVAWTVSPDQRFLLLAGAQAQLVWIDIKSGLLALRLQLAFTAKTNDSLGAVALSPQGRFELLGSVEDPDQFLVCRAGPYSVPSALCRDWLGQAGVVAAILHNGR